MKFFLIEANNTLLREIYSDAELFDLKENDLIITFLRDFGDRDGFDVQGEIESLKDLSDFLNKFLKSKESFVYDSTFASKFRESDTLHQFTAPLVGIADAIRRTEQFQSHPLRRSKDFPTNTTFSFDFRMLGEMTIPRGHHIQMLQPGQGLPEEFEKLYNSQDGRDRLRKCLFFSGYESNSGIRFLQFIDTKIGGDTIVKRDSKGRMSKKLHGLDAQLEEYLENHGEVCNVGKNSSELKSRYMEMDNLHFAVKSWAWNIVEEGTRGFNIFSDTIKTQFEVAEKNFETLEWGNILTVCGALAIPMTAIYIIS